MSELTSNGGVLHAALEYTRLGLPVIPLCPPQHEQMSATHRDICHSPGKMPVVKNWTQRGVPEEAEVQEWFERNPKLNVGLILGDAGASAGWNIVGIDIDGEQAEQSLRELSKGVLPDTWEFKTAQGRRLLYMLPEGSKSRKFKRKEQDGELAFLASGQQTVLPPSIHHTGYTYIWVDGRAPEEMVLSDAPQWLLNRVLQTEGDDEHVQYSPPVESEDWDRTVGEGERNNHLAKLAGSLIARRTIPKDQVLAFLLDWNKKHCSPPLPEVEVESTVEAIYEAERAKDSSSRRGKKIAKQERVMRPVPVAEQFVKWQKEKGFSWKYSAERGLFYRSDDTTGPWMPVEVLFVRKMVRQLLISEEASWDKMHAVNEVTTALQELLAKEVDREMFDLGRLKHINYVFVRNGMYNWVKGEMQPWNSSTYCTIQLPVDWRSSAKESKEYQRWVEVMHEWITDEDTVKFVQEFIGYCLTPDCSYRTAVFLYGGGANGKSLFLDVISQLFGQHIAFIPLHRIAERFETAGLMDKLINVCGDIDPRYIKETSILKSVISGDVIRAEYKYGKSFHFVPTSRLIFSANALPKSSDRTYGWYARWRFVEFPHQFEVNPRFKRELLETFETEEGLSALLCWCVEGLQRLMEQGQFTESYAMQMSAMIYRAENDNVVAFTEGALSAIEVHDFESLPRELLPKPLALPSLYRVYTNWCNEQGLKPAAQTEFTKRLVTTCGFLKRVRPIGGRSTNCLVNAEIEPMFETDYKFQEGLRRSGG